MRVMALLIFLSGCASNYPENKMPAAVPETAGTLANWGLMETAPGVFAAPCGPRPGNAAIMSMGEPISNEELVKLNLPKPECINRRLKF
jgi:hypothetical protein